MKGLVDRLTAAPQVDKAGTWKMARPSLDKLGTWLERGFTNFIAGEGETAKPAETNGKETTFSGPFSQYSTISSTTSSAVPSPQMSTTNLADISSAPPHRSGSAMGLRPASGAGTQIARAASAIDYLRRKPSPVPRVSSASAASFGDLPAGGPYPSPYGYGYTPDRAPKADRSSLFGGEGEQELDESDIPCPW